MYEIYRVEDFVRFVENNASFGEADPSLLNCSFENDKEGGTTALSETAVFKTSLSCISHKARVSGVHKVARTLVKPGTAVAGARQRRDHTALGVPAASTRGALDVEGRVIK